MNRQLAIDQLFDLDAVLDGTQDFRWRGMGDAWYSGVLSGNLLHIRQSVSGVEYRAHSDLNALLRSYFRLDDDLDAIYADISSRDDNVARLVSKYPRLRLLRQPDPWECTVAYICSTTNSIGRIRAACGEDSKSTRTPAGVGRRGSPCFPDAFNSARGRG